MIDDASSFRIVQATMDQIELVVPLFDAYRQFYRQASDLAQARQFIFDRLHNAESIIFLAIVEAGEEQRALGFTQLYPTFSSVSMKRLWILNDLFVDPQARGQGVARALLERARQFAIETGAKGLTLATAIDNLTAQRLYEQAGYGRDEQFYRYDLLV